MYTDKEQGTGNISAAECKILLGGGGQSKAEIAMKMHTWQVLFPPQFVHSSPLSTHYFFAPHVHTDKKQGKGHHSVAKRKILLGGIDLR